MTPAGMRKNLRGRLRRPAFAHSRLVWIALALLAAVVFVALFGQLLAPHDPEAIVGRPVQKPSTAFPLGTDLLGRDVASRVLAGGLFLLGYSVIATALAYVIGGAIGLFAGYNRSVASAVTMRIVDLMLVFPPLLFLLLLVAGLGSRLVVITLGIVILHVPGIARIVYAASLETGVRGFVEAAVARGESTRYVLRKEMLPNITGTIAADAGPRLTVTIFLFAGLSFLGLGVQPPNPDWALMIAENRQAISIQPWAVAAPVIVIAILTLAVNVIADAVARAHGTSIDVPEMARR
jgi:peptide/nickel transport system permease protein